MDSPKISDSQADLAFKALAQSLRLDPDNPWIGHYVEYEWNHARYLFEALDPSIANHTVLEFGCNVGASAIVLAYLKANVIALEIEQNWLNLARLNARRYGVESQIEFVNVEDSRLLPFAANTFDLIVCNSVLEYVPSQHLAAVQVELDRVLKPGGRILITGTSNRLSPIDLHSRRWLTNYLPRCLDRWLFAKHLPERGVWPWQMRYGFGANYIDLDQQALEPYRKARLALISSPYKKLAFKLMSRLLKPFGMTPNWLSSSITITLQKPYN